MPNKGLDVVQVRLVLDKTLYSEEQLSSPEQIVQFMRKELAEYDREVLCVLNCTTKKPGDQYEYCQYRNDQCISGDRPGSV